MLLKTLITITCLSSFLSSSLALRLRNAGKETLVLYPSQDVLSPGGLIDWVVIPEYFASYTPYPVKCANQTCDYPATRVHVNYSITMPNSGFASIIAIDLTNGFNIPITVSPMFSSACKGLKCNVDLSDICNSSEDQVVDEDGKLVACKNSENSVQRFHDLCPEAIANKTADSVVHICYQTDFEVVFG